MLRPRHADVKSEPLKCNNYYSEYNYTCEIADGESAPHGKL